MAGDWIRLYRDARDHEVFQDDWLWRLFSWCLLSANFRPGSWKGTPIAVGQFVTGRTSGAESLHVTPSKFYRGLQKLSELGCITLEANSKWTTVTICNWKSYQTASSPERTANEQPMNSERTADEQRMNTIEEEQEFKNSITHTAQGDSLTFLTGPSAAMKRFREAYPNKIKPKATDQEFINAVTELVQQRQMTDAEAENYLIGKAESYATSPAGMPPPPGQDEDFRPSGAEWLKAGRYDEPYSVWMKPNIKGNRNGNGSGGYSTGGKKPPSECVGVGEPIDIEAIINSVPITRSSEKST